MVFLRTLRSYNLYTLLKLQNPSQLPHTYLHTPFIPTHPIISISPRSLLLSSIFQRPISLFARFEQKVDADLIDSEYVKEQRKEGTKKRLDILFKEAVGLAEKLERSDSEDKSESDSETKDLKKKLRALEVDVRTLKENKLRNLKENSKEIEKLKKKPKIDDEELKGETKPRRLYALFTHNEDASRKKSGESEAMRMEDPKVYKELSPDMVLFVRHLYDEGYFKDANFLPRNKFDVTCFENSYGRDFIKFAAEKFGKDHQEIAKWLSGSDLKKVALVGCPSLARKNIFSAKRLRTFFAIQENNVCSKCILKHSCKFVNQSVWRGDTKTLNLAVVMRVITLYALELVPPQLVVPDEVKASVSRLLKEVVSLGQTVS
ncbi:unnamed protein product [Ilex paraguariensis]|uniref:Uncharacterized protein n=1 Tax=Ilex paraguariensis TaxID=185542 RepID=A0ABC8TEG8_9AQUA